LAASRERGRFFYAAGQAAMSTFWKCSGDLLVMGQDYDKVINPRVKVVHHLAQYIAVQFIQAFEFGNTSQLRKNRFSCSFHS
jgi:hypothetical protein